MWKRFQEMFSWNPLFPSVRNWLRMETSSSDAGLELVTQGLELLRSYLPPEWEVRVMTPDNVAVAGPDLLPARPAYLDSVVEVSDGSSLGRLMVEAKTTFGPRDVDTLLGGINRTLRRLTSAGVLVIAPSLSARTRELLASSGINYLDLNGNVRLQLSRPGLFVERTATAKASRDQHTSAFAGLRGPRAGRLVRALVDASGPWTVRELAETAELSPGYVSKLLEGLEQEALVKRGRRGVVEQVDWSALLRVWAQNYSVLKSNTVGGFIARHGPLSILHALVEAIGLPRWAVTGSYGAVTLAPVAAPSMLMLYTPAGAELSGRLDQLLLPAEESADVVIVEPADEVVFKRTWTARFVDRRNVVQTDEPGLWPLGRVPVVAPSQLAVDCLSGPGRMPAEGEALLKWMQGNEHLWRAASPDDIDQDRMQLSEMAAPW
jgi:hypothetical protein